MRAMPAQEITGEVLIEGQMGVLMRSHDWSQTPLGSAQTWLQSLKTALNILFNVCYPMLLVWGDDRILFYNDAYSTVLSQTNVEIPFGQSIAGSKNAAESSIYSAVEQVFSTGRTLQLEHQPLPTNRDGNIEAPIYNWCYSPLWDETGQVGGVFATGHKVNSPETATAFNVTQSQAIAEPLRQPEEQLRLIINALPVLIAYVDKDHYYRFNNQAYSSWFGQPAATFTNRHVRDVLGFTAYEAVRPYMEQALSGQKVSYESEITYQEGRTRYIKADYIPHINSQGEVIGFFALVSDISDRKRIEEERNQAEAARGKSEEDFRAMFNLTSVGMVQADVKTRRLIRVNAAFCAITGYTEAELLALKVDDINHPEELDRDQERFISLIQGETATYQAEKRYLRKDGSTVWVFVTGNVIQDAEEEAIRIVAVIQDITERKQAETALRESEERFHFVTQAVNGLIFDWNLQTNKVYRSEKLYDLLGIAADDAPLDATWWHERIHPDDRARLQPQLDQLYASSAHLYDAEYRIRHEDGHWIDLWEQARLLRDEQGQITRIVGCTVDISARKQTEEALRRSEQRLRVSQELSLDAFTILDSVRDESGAIVDFVWTYVNPKAAEILQHPANELIGQRLLQVLPGNRLNRELFERYVRVVETGNSHDIELCYETDGITGWFRNMAVKLEDGAAIFFSDISDRKRSEQALMESETIARTKAEELAALMEITPAAIWIARDVQCHQMTANQTAYRLMQVEPGGVTTATPEDGSYSLPFKQSRNGEEIPPQDLPMQKAIRTRQEVTDELEFLFEDGTVQYIYGKAVPLYDWAGEIRGAIAAFVDISDRKRMEEALKTSEERLRFAVEGAALGTWEYDLASSEIIWSPAAKIMFGVALDAQVDYQVFIDAIHPDDRDRVHDAVERAVAQQEIYDVEMRTVWADGSIHWIRSIGRARYNQNALPTRMIGVVLDITERKQAEEDLQTSERRFRRLVESNMFGVAFGDFNGEIQYVNDYFLNIVGYTREEIESGQLGWIDLTPKEFLPLEEKALTELRSKGVAKPFEKEYICKDGSRVPVFIGLALLQEPYDKQEGIVAFHLNLTEQKQAEAERERLLKEAQIAREEAETANRIKDEFLAVLSHELRSPLNPILGWSKLLQTRQFDESGRQRALQTIERNAKLQTQLIEDLLDVSRILRGKMSLNIYPVNLATVVESALETVRLAAEAKQIQIQSIITAENAPILGDATRLQQIVWNLISNAVKFTPDGGRVEVSLSSSDGHLSFVEDESQKTNDKRLRTNYAQIQVKDTGKGISSEFLPYVFDYFRQEDGRTTRKFGGLGLGLAIVRHLTELHGGTVHAESPGEGQGATFIVRLPLMSKVTDSGKELTTTTKVMDLSKVQILLVDDEPDMRDLVQVILEQQAMQVRVAASAAEALKLFDEQLPDIFISDIGMPEVDGYMLMQQIRSRSPKQGGLIKAIALTAYAGDYDQKQAKKVGFQRHLAKPVEPEDLVRAIADLLLQH
ncbi:PAS domain S-box protein [Aerosakkonemataceae cyanobacterium BLCC-F50]|uniref:histidine kinase n=1 Tax=Floridaenema flaviceps BLCC-F50 TaxID=3153642 RepID=A0ABV4XME3_9CYAN